MAFPGFSALPPSSSHAGHEAAPVPVAVPVPRDWPLRAALLAVWAVGSFGVCYFARSLDVMVQGWPLGVWMAGQGALGVFLLVVVAYAVGTGRSDRREAVRVARAAADTPAAGDPAGAADARSPSPAARAPHG
ncbi:DUF4212 domain-containing protein [Sphingomonas sp. NCPPB 2930]